MFVRIGVLFCSLFVGFSVVVVVSSLLLLSCFFLYAWFCLFAVWVLQGPNKILFLLPPEIGPFQHHPRAALLLVPFSPPHKKERPLRVTPNHPFSVSPPTVLFGGARSNRGLAGSVICASPKFGTLSFGATLLFMYCPLPATKQVNFAQGVHKDA